MSIRKLFNPPTPFTDKLSLLALELRAAARLEADEKAKSERIWQHKQDLVSDAIAERSEHQDFFDRISHEGMDDQAEFGAEHKELLR